MDPAEILEKSYFSRRRVIDEGIQRGDSNVQRFYDDSVIFMTGGSGFLGKHFIEKLFRSCQVRKVYLLMRPKKSKTPKQRIAEIFKDPIMVRNPSCASPTRTWPVLKNDFAYLKVYNYLHEIQPAFTDRIVIVEGDVSQNRLGISQDDWVMLIDEVEIIFHAAATINFEENLKYATLTNVCGTMEMIELGKACKKLRSFVYISTAYCHCTKSKINKGTIFEEFYPSPLPPNDLVNLVKHLDDQRLTSMTPSLTEDWPNTYSFTKAVAEEVVRTATHGLPICIVRPAIVIASHNEPAPGWLDMSCAFGPTGLVLGTVLGVLHVMLASKDVHADLVPVDLVNNAIMAAALEATRTGGDQPKIFTVTRSRNPITMQDIENAFNNEGRKFASSKAVWHCYGWVVNNQLLFMLLTWILHYIPAYFIDGVLLTAGKKLRISKIYNKIYKLNKLFGFYLCNSWHFDDSNLFTLYQHMSSTDQLVFNCDLGTISRQEQLITWLLGTRKYIVKDGLQGTDIGIKKLFWFKIANYIVGVFYFYALFKFFKFVLSIFFLCTYCLISFFKIYC